jgi:hypothetical protein
MTPCTIIFLIVQNFSRESSEKVIMKNLIFILSLVSFNAFSSSGGMVMILDGPSQPGTTYSTDSNVPIASATYSDGTPIQFIPTSNPAPATPVAPVVNAPVPYNQPDYWNRPSDNSSYWNRRPGSDP